MHNQNMLMKATSVLLNECVSKAKVLKVLGKEEFKFGILHLSHRGRTVQNVHLVGKSTNKVDLVRPSSLKQIKSSAREK